MITIIEKKRMEKDVYLYKYRGLSTDTKPTEGVSNGSEFLEIDTGFTSYYDATPSTGGWTEAPSS